MGVSENRGGTLFWGPYNKDSTYYSGYYSRAPYFRKLGLQEGLNPEPETLMVEIWKFGFESLGSVSVPEIPNPRTPARNPSQENSESLEVRGQARPVAPNPSDF